MDNQETGSNGALDVNQAVSLLSAAMDTPPPDREAAAEPEAAPPEATAEPEPQPEAAAEPQAQEEDTTVTVKIDGKDVEVPLSELKNGYQRQADYTRKTMEASDTRKAAEAQIAQAQQERQAYAANLQRMQAQLEGALQEQQQKVNWEELLQSDPVEYLRQQHQAQARQAQLGQVYAEQQRVAALQQAEQAHVRQSYLAQQQDELLAKLPDWKNESKAKAEKTALRDYLLDNGYDRHTVDTITDAKAVLLARKAMLYDQMVGKASAAAKKVSALPQKVERPGQGDNPGITPRTAAYLRLNKTGKVEDAARAFAAIL